MSIISDVTVQQIIIIVCVIPVLTKHKENIHKWKPFPVADNVLMGLGTVLETLKIPPENTKLVNTLQVCF